MKEATLELRDRAISMLQLSFLLDALKENLQFFPHSLQGQWNMYCILALHLASPTCRCRKKTLGERKQRTEPHMLMCIVAQS